MKAILVVSAAVLLATSIHVHAKTRHVVRHSTGSGVTVYNRDSPNPNIGWHTDASGMRSCTYDCDNLEIPGSGARCRSTTFMGISARECVTGGDF